MKLSEWKKSYDNKYPKLSLRVISVSELLSITDFDGQPERLNEKDSDGVCDSPTPIGNVGRGE
jgi:hypothetical protein